MLVELNPAGFMLTRTSRRIGFVMGERTMGREVVAKRVHPTFNAIAATTRPQVHHYG
jgi:hypothetical protein